MKQKEILQDVDIPTHRLFHMTKKFFKNLTQGTFNDLKGTCDKNDPHMILTDLKHHLEDKPSIYFKRLKIYNFTSYYAEELMKNINGTLIKLVLSYGSCRALKKRHHRGSIESFQETVNSIVKLIEKQRREVPNMLTADHVRQHLQALSIPKCERSHRAKDFHWHFDCKYYSSVSFC